MHALWLKQLRRLLQAWPSFWVKRSWSSTKHEHACELVGSHKKCIVGFPKGFRSTFGNHQIQHDGEGIRHVSFLMHYPNASIR